MFVDASTDVPDPLIPGAWPYIALLTMFVNAATQGTPQPGYLLVQIAWSWRYVIATTQSTHHPQQIAQIKESLFISALLRRVNFNYRQDLQRCRNLRIDLMLDYLFHRTIVDV